MSLANLIVQPGRAVLQADAAACFRDGTVAALRPKLYTYHRARAAFSKRGSIHQDCLNVALHEHGADQITSLADLLAMLPGAAKQAAELTEASYDGGSAAGFTIIGWCDQRRAPIGLIMTNDVDWFGGKLQPFKFVVVDNAIGSHDALADIGLGDVAELSDPARFDIDRDSVRLIEAQRRRAWGSWPKEDASYASAVRIGGWVDQAEVTAGGVSERRIMQWPQDRVGERIAA